MTQGPDAPRSRLLVGIDDAPPVPMQQGTPESGDFRGYEVDLIEEIARRLGVAVRYRRAPWSIILGELADGRIDAVCSAATVTAERERQVDFCAPHLRITLAVVTRDGEARGTALTGRRAGVRTGTTAEAHAVAHGAAEGLVRSESNEELYAALAGGALDAVVDDAPIAAHFARAVPGLRLAGPLPGTDAAYAIAVRKGNDPLRRRIDAALGAMDAEGMLAALRRRWGLA